MMKKSGLRDILAVAMKSPWWTGASVLLAVLSAAAMYMPYVSIIKILSAALTSNAGTGGLSGQLIYGWGLVALIGACASVILDFSSLICSHVAAFGISLKMKTELCRHLAGIPMGSLQEQGSGRIYKIIDGDIGQVQSFIAHEIPHVVIAFANPCFLAVIMFAIDWRYAIAICLGLAVALWFSKKSNSYGAGGAHNMMDVYLEAIEKLGNESVEYVRGISVVKMFGQTSKSVSKLHGAITDYTKLVIPYTVVWEKYRCYFAGILSNLYLLLAPTAMLIAGVSGSADFDAADFIFFLVLVPSVALVVPKLAGVTNQLVRAETALDHVNRIMGVEQLARGSGSIDAQHGEVSFENVSFSYNGDRAQALKAVCFRAEPGTVTAIVGSSGSGKSTIAALLARFWESYEGKICIGGEEIRSISEESLMKNTAFVFQDVFLFRQSVFDNIKGGVETATRQDVENAAKAARCHDFITALPQGYDTVIGENGIHLSGGERQRISIARAIVKDAPIVVFDEATASADPENEYEIQQALDSLIKSKTVIMIAHSLPTVQSADNILVMERGSVVEAGTHEQLMEKKGKYYEMWDKYSQSIQWRVGKKAQLG
ncbi:MAG: ABC transporter ATP-binding protein [Syntrophomonadaceae bacterium]|nr:ABC transporter ATP-binding protein [Syntrophomonadaceae bacterium]